MALILYQLLYPSDRPNGKAQSKIFCIISVNTVNIHNKLEIKLLWHHTSIQVHNNILPHRTNMRQPIDARSEKNALKKIQMNFVAFINRQMYVSCIFPKRQLFWVHFICLNAFFMPEYFFPHFYEYVRLSNIANKKKREYRSIIQVMFSTENVLFMQHLQGN